ncbi:methyltransferase [Pseudovibrio sp. Tun.PSC04-5.I4]|uniref:methyltransferase n=1 Tax=Pseudovibrio sp. Tun.PSC04-5.I4 TaxID=1798213 RepID=UPI000B8579E0|nr:methyltransferase [Pseudovibrio sp. Tun.PSC04-5.I4]
MSPHDKVLELGACIGFISSFAAKTCSSNNVVCVEANPELIPVIKTNHALNNVSPTVVTGVASLEDYDKCDFYIGKRAYGYSTLQRKGSRKIQQHSAGIEGREIDLLPQLKLRDINLIIEEFHPFLSSFDTVTDCIKTIIEEGV